MNFLNTKTAMIVAGVLAGGLVLYVLARKAGGAAGMMRHEISSLLRAKKARSSDRCIAFGSYSRCVRS